MTRYSDNISSGFQAVTSALSSKSVVSLHKVHRFTQPSGGGATPQTVTGTFPPGIENITANLWIMNQSTSASTSDKITVSAGGTNLITYTAMGSATGILGTSTVAGLGTVAVVASACAIPPVPASTNNGGEIPYAVTFLPVSASKGTDYRLRINFNRADSNTLGTSQ